jgi:uncharacterized flavoprotein (TIGR03862 family)
VKVTVFDAKPSVGRKFLVAGRGGLNITKAEPLDRFLAQYTGPAETWASLIAGFDPNAIRDWAAGLGIETFAASTGRVYPREMKAAPLLRRWIARLRQLGVGFEMNHRWTGLQPTEDGIQITFHKDENTARMVTVQAVILALGGASWPETGSDGRWQSILHSLGIGVTPLQPANCGWELPWPDTVRARGEGQPLKNVVVRAGKSQALGELMITSYGLEGGAIYQLGAALRAMDTPAITIDFKPSFTVQQLVSKLGPIKRDFLTEAKTRWRLSDAAVAVLESRGPYSDAETLAREAKEYRLQLTGPRPIDEAISSAGGVRWDELTPELMLHRYPGVFVAGEMIDWEAPTGGYLMQGCFATGTHAGTSAAAWLQNRLPLSSRTGQEHQTGPR